LFYANRKLHGMLFIKPILLAIVFAATTVSAQDKDDLSTIALQRLQTTSPQDQLLPANYDRWLQSYQHKSLQETFKSIASGVRFEPYTGARRGAIGTAIAQSGNSIDQSMLLAHQLRKLGFQVRFVQGSLSEENKKILLSALFPPNMAAIPDLPDEDRYDPWQDDGLLAQVKHHYWLEISLSGKWIALDPSFPRANPGESYAAADKQWAELPEELYQRVNITQHARFANGEERLLGAIDVATADLGLSPIQLLAIGIPQAEKQEEQKSSTIGAVAGSLGGQTVEQKDDAPEQNPVAVTYSSSISWMLQNAEFESYQVPIEVGDSSVVEEWLEFSITAPNQKSRNVKRWLFRSSDETERPQPYRHYTISLFASQIPTSITETVFDNATNFDWAKSAKQATSEEKIEALTAFNRRLSASIGVLTNLMVASSSDGTNDVSALEKGLVPVYATPRIYIQSSVGGDQASTNDKTTFDLRLDEVALYPFPGYSKSNAYWFQQGRGIRQSTLERAVLTKLTGSDAVVSTSSVMQATQANAVELLIVNSANAKKLENNESLKHIDNRLIKDSLKSGKELILPSEPIVIAGKPTVGWWEVDKETGRVIGVMESGEHQATVENLAKQAKIALDDVNGFAIGMISGTNSTQMLVLSRMLSQGMLTAADIKAIEAAVKNVGCWSCPSVSLSDAASFEVGTDCFSIYKAESKKNSTTYALPFCESFAKGFACAVSVVLSGHRGDEKYDDLKAKIGGGLDFGDTCG